MTNVKRHAFTRNAAEMLPPFEQAVADSLAILKAGDNTVTVLRSLGNEATNLACFASAATRNEAACARGLRLVGEAAVALFLLAAHPGRLVPISLGGDELNLLVPVAHGLAGPEIWRRGFSCALAVRDASRLRALAEVRRDTLDLSQQSARREAFTFGAVSALQALFCGTSDAPELIRAVAKAARASTEDFAASFAADMDLALRVHEREPKAFNESLERALLAHRAFWSKPPMADDFTKDRREHPHGFLALGPLGLACLAHDRGMPVEVESPYIPRWITSPQQR